MYGQRQLWHANDLCDVYHTGCDYRLHVPSGQGILGYGYHPNGDLLLITGSTGGIDTGHVYIYKVRLDICLYELISTIKLDQCHGLIVLAANIDFQGGIYVAPRCRVGDSPIYERWLTRISDIHNPTPEYLFKTQSGQQFWEVHFLRNKTYLVEQNKPYIRVYDQHYVLVDTIITAKHIWGLTSIPYGCDSVVTYATHMGYSTEVYQDIGPDSIMYISRYDLETNTLYPICQYDMGDNGANTNMSSPLEFLSSDPECDLLLDLDRDNSSGVFPYDYRSDSAFCQPMTASICDEDVYLLTSAPLDSIRLRILDARDEGQEYLSFNPPFAGVSFVRSDDSTYLLTSTLNMDTAYMACLRSVRYHHAGAIRTPGIRRIELQGFSAVKAGQLVYAHLDIQPIAKAGEDAVITICGDTTIASMRGLTGGDPGGFWSPPLESSGDLFVSSVDTSDIYLYIVADPMCGTDTAEVSILRDGSGAGSILGPDQVLCPGDSIWLEVMPGYESVMWEDGSQNLERRISETGIYAVEVALSGGCTYADSIQIFPGTRWLPEIIAQNPTCDESNGSVSFSPTDVISGWPVWFNGMMVTDTLIDLLPAGTYILEARSEDGCLDQRTIELVDTPVIQVDMNSMTEIVQNTWGQIQFTVTDGILDTVIFEPTEHIIRDGQNLNVYGAQDQQYKVIFVDQEGCITSKTLTVRVIEEKGVYLPNVFRPDSEHGNDRWEAFIGETYSLVVMRIYDRWGNMLYQAQDAPRWDGTFRGKECPTGVYVYQIVMLHRHSGEERILSGDISLIR